jgi:hypothetical protein
MNRRGAGLAFLAMAAALFAARYVTAAIYGSNITGWNSENFRAMFQYVGGGLTAAAAVALVVGGWVSGVGRDQKGIGLLPSDSRCGDAEAIEHSRNRPGSDRKDINPCKVAN